MNAKEFIFSPRYRLQRYVAYWLLYIVLWAGYWTLVGSTFPLNLGKMIIWLPAFMLYSYPLAYFAVPRWLLNGKYLPFLVAAIAWGIFGWYFNMFYRLYCFFPLAESFHIPHGSFVAEPASSLCLTTGAGCMSVSTLAKRWAKKHGELLQAEREKAAAQLQLLKAQLHPHFLFNTLNNIYSFALENSAKTPQMILKLSSLLSYMLYECRTDEVLLEKEVEVMKNYIDLEKERYGEKLDISLSIEGAMEGRWITPLLILPFLENAFKHGTSEQLERPWLSVDLVVKGNSLNCKVVNSKNEFVPLHQNGVGIANVQKRLELLYPEQYQLKLADEGEFFVVTLVLQLRSNTVARVIPLETGSEKQNLNSYENSLLADRR